MEQIFTAGFWHWTELVTASALGWMIGQSLIVFVRRIVRLYEDERTRRIQEFNKAYQDALKAHAEFLATLHEWQKGLITQGRQE